MNAELRNLEAEVLAAIAGEVALDDAGFDRLARAAFAAQYAANAP